MFLYSPANNSNFIPVRVDNARSKTGIVQYVSTADSWAFCNKKDREGGVEQPTYPTFAEACEEVGVDEEDEEEEYSPLFDRCQLNSKINLSPGLYYVDVQYVIRVNQPPKFWTTPVLTWSQQLAMKISDVPSYECCFLVGAIQGGAKKKGKGQSKKKHKEPSIPLVSGHGGFSFKGLGDIVKSIAKPIVSNAVDSAKQAVVQHATNAVLGSGAYRTKMKGKGAYSTRSGLRTYSGHGAYNSLINPTGSPIHIAHANDETGSITISYREYMRDIFSNGAAFQNLGISINPGLEWAPFLSQIASNFKEYKFEQLIFYYVPTVSNVTAQGQLGTTIMALDYNAGDTLFTNKTVMMGYSGSINDIISNHIAFGVECDSSKGNHGYKYVRTGAVPIGQDVKTYDVGLLQVATAGINNTAFPSGTQIGELHVEYTIRLMKPNISSSAGNDINVDQFAGSSGITVLNLFGTSPNKAISNSLGGTITKSGTATYTLPDNFFGEICVSYLAVGTTMSGQPAIASTGNVTTINTLYDGSNSSTSIVVSSTRASIIAYYSVVPAATAGSNTITISTGSLGAATITAMNFIVSAVNPNMANAYSAQYVSV